MLTAIRGVEFDGLSGPVRFLSTGDRDPLSILYQVRNLFTYPNNVMAVGSSIFAVLENSAWSINASSAVFRVQGTKSSPYPPQFAEPAQNYDYLPNWLKAIAYVETAIIELLAIACISWLYVNRDSYLVINAQGGLLALVALGCGITGFAILMLTADDASSSLSSMNPTTACNASVFLFAVGSELALVALMAKAYRISRLFFNAKLKKRVVRERHMIAAVWLVVAIELVVLIAWVAVAPLVWTRTVTFSDANGFPVSSWGGCLASNDETSSFVGVVFGLHGASALLSFMMLSSPRTNLADGVQNHILL
jgi:uncharacterized membrane protein YidH (DUF202 family)